MPQSPCMQLSRVPDDARSIINAVQVEINKLRRGEAQQALQERNILPPKTLPDMRETLLQVTTLEPRPRPIDMNKTLKVRALAAATMAAAMLADAYRTMF